MSYYASADYISKKEEVLLTKIHKMRYEELKSPDKATLHKEQFKKFKKSVTEAFKKENKKSSHKVSRSKSLKHNDNGA